MGLIRFKGNYAVVTGGGSGIGHAFVKRLLEVGCSVLVGDLALRPEAEETARAYPHPPAAPGQATCVFQKAEVTSWQELSTLWQVALDVFPQVDLVVPCAGVFEPPRSSFWHPPGVVGSPSADNAAAAPGTYASIDINLTHPIRLAQMAIGYWTSRKRPGHLLFVGSVAGYTASIGTPLYYACKAGLHGFVMSLAMLRQRLGIRVMCIAPGGVRTPLWDADYCKDKLLSGDPALSAEMVAQIMMDLVTDDKYGDAQIVEAMDIGPSHRPEAGIREVPVQLLYPTALAQQVGSVVEEEEKLWKKLETEGLQAK